MFHFMQLTTYTDIRVEFHKKNNDMEKNVCITWRKKPYCVTGTHFSVQVFVITQLW